MRRILFLLALVGFLAALVAACASKEDNPDQRATLEWAGFSDTSGLEIVAHEYERGPDVLARFALRGSSAAIDSSLAAAGLTETAPPGTSLEPPSGLSFPPNFGLSDLDNVRAGEDVWDSPSGARIYRKYVRGETRDGNGDHLLIVWANTR